MPKKPTDRLREGMARRAPEEEIPPLPTLVAGEELAGVGVMEEFRPRVAALAPDQLIELVMEIGDALTTDEFEVALAKYEVAAVPEVPLMPPEGAPVPPEMPLTPPMV